MIPLYVLIGFVVAAAIWITVTDDRWITHPPMLKITMESIECSMEELVWDYKLFSVTKDEDGVKTDWLVSLSELLQMDEVEESVKRAAVEQYLTMVSRDMPKDQADHVMRLIRKRLIPGLLPSSSSAARLTSYSRARRAL